LLPALLENPSVRDESLDGLALSGSRSVIETLLTSPRVMNSARFLRALQANPALRPNELAEIGKKLSGLDAGPADAAPEADAADEVVEGAVAKYLEEHAAEVEAEKDKPFQPIGMESEGIDHERRAQDDGVVEASVAAGPEPVPPSAVAGADAAAKSPALAGKPGAPAAHAKKRPPPVPVERRDSTLQKISRLDIKGRIALAMRGTKEERSILIRDSTKLVAIAVLDSPKVSDGEVEKFALQKNVLEAVLRTIPMKRKFAKNYSITRNLVYNPRTPLDLSLGLMKNLLIHDLKNLSDNKEVPDTIRKLALRMFKQKMEKKN
jgi:hypothetical protein